MRRRRRKRKFTIKNAQKRGSVHFYEAVRLNNGKAKSAYERSCIRHKICNNGSRPWSVRESSPFHPRQDS